jgi:hypothetical protein
VIAQDEDIANGALPSESTSVAPLEMEQPDAGPSVTATVITAVEAAVFSAIFAVCPELIEKT